MTEEEHVACRLSQTHSTGALTFSTNHGIPIAVPDISHVTFENATNAGAGLSHDFFLGYSESFPSGVSQPQFDHSALGYANNWSSNEFRCPPQDVSYQPYENTTSVGPATAWVPTGPLSESFGSIPQYKFDFFDFASAHSLPPSGPGYLLPLNDWSSTIPFGTGFSTDAQPVATFDCQPSIPTTASMQMNTALPADGSTDLPEPRTNKGKIRCTEPGCNKTFGRPQELRRHLEADRRRKTNTGWRCVVSCDYEYPRWDKVRIHMGNKHGIKFGSVTMGALQTEKDE